MEDTPAKPLREDRSGADDAPTFYANHVNVIVTPFDMRLRFSQIRDVNNERVLHHDVANIYLSPAQARALRRVLLEKIEAHEAIWAQVLSPVDVKT